MSAHMLKETALSITPVVPQLYNFISLKLEISDECKNVHVSPVPKSHNMQVWSQKLYHPISLLSVLSKLLEKHVRNLLVDNFEEFNPLSTQQWYTLSTTGALLAAMDNWYRLLNSGFDICTVFFDFSKAFNTVPHRPLLQNLKNLIMSIFTSWNSLPKV